MVIAVWLHMFRVFHDRVVQTAREFSLGRRRDPARVDPAPVVHRLPAAVGPALDLGGDRRLEHGPRDAPISATRVRPRLVPGPEQLCHDARAFLFGGGEIGPHTLMRFYILHCIFIPLVTSLFLAVHFWRIRRDGFSGPAL
jgi:hypothetical protein